jgi:hypothetical protein
MNDDIPTAADMLEVRRKEFDEFKRLYAEALLRSPLGQALGEVFIDSETLEFIDPRRVSQSPAR